LSEEESEAEASLSESEEEVKPKKRVSAKMRSVSCGSRSDPGEEEQASSQGGVGPVRGGEAQEEGEYGAPFERELN